MNITSQFGYGRATPTISMSPHPRPLRYPFSTISSYGPM
jgi:hypothetical protein